MILKLDILKLGEIVSGPQWTFLSSPKKADLNVLSEGPFSSSLCE